MEHIASLFPHFVTHNEPKGLLPCTKVELLLENRKELIIAKEDETVSQIILKMKENHLSAIPVVSNTGQVLGLIDMVRTFSL